MARAFFHDRRKIASCVAAGAVFLLAWAGGVAAEPLCREQSPKMDKFAYLRALSLDLRGYVPSVQEYEALASESEVPDALVREWLGSADFARRVSRAHRSLIWPNLSAVRLIGLGRYLVRPSTGPWYRPQVAVSMRGGISRRGCADQPAQFEPDGSVRFLVTGEEVANVGGGVRRVPYQQEGYVMVAPYWDPTTEIKVCALDAQTQTHSRTLGKTDRLCSARSSQSDPGCGCGPGLRWCGTRAADLVIRNALIDEVERRIGAVAQRGESYDELLTGRRAFVNGPLSFFWRHLTQAADRTGALPVGVNVESMPALAFTDVDTWHEITLPQGHSGILTSPLYLLRFQTNRARASRFYDAFLCDPFVPPPGGIPFDDPLASAQPDIQQKPGCNYCHAALEPAAAHWGRWTEQGAGFLREAEYPAFNNECSQCRRGGACSTECTQHYITSSNSAEGSAYWGYLRAFEFLRPEHQDNVDGGPRALVAAAAGDGRFVACTARRAVEWLLGTSVEEGDAGELETLSRAFVTSGLNYQQLVYSVVNTDAYRRVR